MQRSIPPYKKLSGILGLIEQMQAVDTTGIVPISHSQDVTQRLREDVVTKTNQRDAFQKMHPNSVMGPLNKPWQMVCILYPKSSNKLV